MTIPEFLALFSTVKPTKKGWDVPCPAHDDRHPSLGVMEGVEGRIVLNCLAGCRVEDICAALGLELTDLFADEPISGKPRPMRPPIRQQTPHGIAFAFDLHALDLRLAADKILAAAAKCDDCTTWTEEEHELAMRCVAKAYAYQERAAWCEEYADHVRVSA